MEIPEGMFYGALPDEIVIDGVRWDCIKTGDIDGVTYDKLQSRETGELKVIQRGKLIRFLEKIVKKDTENVAGLKNDVIFTPVNNQLNLIL